MKRAKKMIFLAAISFFVICIGIYLSQRDDVPERREFEVQMIEYHPRLRENISEFERVSLIRDWAYSQIPSAQSSAYMDIKDERIYNSDPAEFVANVLRLNENLAGGFYCGGIAATLAAIYRTLGYPAFTLDMAVQDDEGTVVQSHVVTLVDIGEEGGHRWIVQDATFNVTYTDTGGEPLDIYQIRELLDKGHTDDIVISHGETQYQHGVAAGSMPEEDLYPIDGSREYVVKNGRCQYWKESVLSLYSNEMVRKYGQFFERDGYPLNNIYLFLYPWAIYDMWGSDELVPGERSRLIETLRPHEQADAAAQ